MIIYMAINTINNNMYIGKTIQKLDKRKTDHMNYVNNQNSQTYFHRAIRKYGIEKFEWKILCETDSESKLSVLEKFYIATYRTMHKLYNMTDGGEGVRLFGESNGFYGKKHSEETKKHWSKTRKGKPNPNSGRIRKGKENNFYGKKHTEESKKKMSEAQKGEKHWHYGKKMKKETKEKLSQSQKGISREYAKKPVYQINKDTNEIIKEWNGIVDAQKELNISHITDVCYGKRKTAGGFKWAFVKDYDSTLYIL